VPVSVHFVPLQGHEIGVSHGAELAESQPECLPRCVGRIAPRGDDDVGIGGHDRFGVDHRRDERQVREDIAAAAERDGV